MRLKLKYLGTWMNVSWTSKEFNNKIALPYNNDAIKGVTIVLQTERKFNSAIQLWGGGGYSMYDHDHIF